MKLRYRPIFLNKTSLYCMAVGHDDRLLIGRPPSDVKAMNKGIFRR